MGSNSAAWSINVIAVIMFKGSYGFSVRMIFAFVFAVILFPSETWSPAGVLSGWQLRGDAAKSQCWGAWATPRRLRSLWVQLLGAHRKAPMFCPA